jgi:hypothetical protein
VHYGSLYIGSQRGRRAVRSRKESAIGESSRNSDVQQKIGDVLLFLKRVSSKAYLERLGYLREERRERFCRLVPSFSFWLVTEVERFLTLHSRLTFQSALPFDVDISTMAFFSDAITTSLLRTFSACKSKWALHGNCQFVQSSLEVCTLHYSRTLALSSLPALHNTQPTERMHASPIPKNTKTSQFNNSTTPLRLLLTPVPISPLPYPNIGSILTLI